MFARLAPFAAALAAGLVSSFLLFTPVAEMAWPLAVLRAATAVLFLYGLARLVVWAASRLFLPREQRIDGLGSKAAGAAAAWLVPFAVFWDRLSPLAVVSAAMAAAMFAWVFASHSARNQDERPSKLIWAVAAALLLQAAGTAAGLERWRISAAAVIALSVLLAWMLFVAFGPPRSRGTGVVSHCVTAALLVSIAWIRREPGSGGPITGKVLAAVFSAAEKPRAHPGETTDEDAHQTIQLWPEDRETVALIPPRSVPAIPTPGKANEKVIPFFGAYWFYRGRQPSANPAVMHGDPAKESFRNQGFRALSMDAVQNFGQRIDASCCRAIELAILNADRHPDTVDLELLLRDTAAGGVPVSLGRRRVTTSVFREGRDTRPPAPETLRFPIAGVSRYTRFDEVTVRFHLLNPRADRSAMISIRHFSFVQ